MKKKGFTLIELLVVISIIALLLSILMPSLNRVKKLAQFTVCQSNMRQWGIIFSSFVVDNDNKFNKGWIPQTSPDIVQDQLWMVVLKSYYTDPKIRLCPLTKDLELRMNPYKGVWHFSEDIGGRWQAVAGDYGSYGINAFVQDMDFNVEIGGDVGYADLSKLCWVTPDYPRASDIPVFTESWWYTAWPDNGQEAPPYRDIKDPRAIGGDNAYSMSRICIDRHEGYLNMLFMDWSVRKVGLKQLWTLRWHKAVDTKGPKTLAGGATYDWPEWMEDYKDF